MNNFKTVTDGELKITIDDNDYHVTGDSIKSHVDNSLMLEYVNDNNVSAVKVKNSFLTKLENMKYYMVRLLAFQTILQPIF